MTTFMLPSHHITYKWGRIDVNTSGHMTPYCHKKKKKKTSFDSLKFRAADWWHAVKINTVDKPRNGAQWDAIQTGTKPWCGSQIKLKSYLGDKLSHGSPAGSVRKLHQGHSWWIFPSVKAGCVCAAYCREGFSIQLIFSLYISIHFHTSGCFTCFAASSQ